MKKLITLLIAFMLTASINSYASFTDENGTTRLSYEVTPLPGDYVNQVDGPINIMFTDQLPKTVFTPISERLIQTNLLTARQLPVRTTITRSLPKTSR